MYLVVKSGMKYTFFPILGFYGVRYQLGDRWTCGPLAKNSKETWFLESILGVINAPKNLKGFPLSANASSFTKMETTINALCENVESILCNVSGVFQDGMIVGIGKAGNPDVMEGVHSVSLPPLNHS